MPKIPYLTGNETVNAARMNALFGELDRKMAVVLGGGKSPLIRSGAGEWGQPFPFVSETVPQFYAGRCPGVTLLDRAIPTPTSPAQPGRWVKPYRHGQFTAHVPVVTALDEVNRIATIQDVPVARFEEYRYFTQAVVSNVRGGWSFYDYSLDTHRMKGRGAGGLSGTDGISYFYKEAGLGHHERFMDYALAEVLIEGVTSALLPGDKYCFFRIHNLQPVQAVVTFENGGHSVTLKPWECRTVRRVRIVTGAGTPEMSVTFNYPPVAAGEPQHYFFPFFAGDQRRAGFIRTQRSFSGPNPVNAQGGNDPFVWNSMRANNVSNPAVALEWVNQLELSDSGWKIDPHERAPSTLTRFFGDASLPDTPVGDLFHHRGKIMVVKVHKTLKMPAPNSTVPVMEWREVLFRGYDTLAADLGAVGVTVREITTNARLNGNLEFTANDPNWTYDLVLTGVNLFNIDGRIGTYAPVSPISVIADLASYLPAIHDFAFDTGTGLSDLAPARAFPISLVSTPDSRPWRKDTGVLTTKPGEPLLTLTENNPAQRKRMRGMHKVKVSSLLDFSYFGDSSLPSQDGPYMKRENARLNLTPEGWVLLYDEVMPTYPRVTFFQDKLTDVGVQVEGSAAQIRFPRAIPFRWHGFAMATQDAALCLGPDHPLVAVDAYPDELVGRDGADVQPRELSPEVLKMTQLWPVLPDRLRLVFGQNGRRYWMQVEDPGVLVAIGRILLQSEPQRSVSYNAVRGSFRFSRRPVGATLDRPVTAHMLADYYNLLAQRVNACGKGKVIPFGAFYFWVPASSGYLHFEAGAFETPGPVPVNCFCMWTKTPPSRPSTAQATAALAKFLGLVPLTSDDLPDFQGFSEQDTYFQDINMTYSGEVSTSGPSGESIDVNVASESAANIAGAAWTGVSAFGPNAPSAPLFAFGTYLKKTDYANYEWITVQQVMSLFAGASYVERIEPLVMRLCELPGPKLLVDGVVGNNAYTTVENIPVSSLSAPVQNHVIFPTADAALGLPTEPVFPPGAYLIDPEGEASGSFVIARFFKRLVAFQPPIDGEIPRWKRQQQPAVQSVVEPTYRYFETPALDVQATAKHDFIEWREVYPRATPPLPPGQWHTHYFPIDELGFGAIVSTGGPRSNPPSTVVLVTRSYHQQGRPNDGINYTPYPNDRDYALSRVQYRSNATAFYTFEGEEWDRLLMWIQGKHRISGFYHTDSKPLECIGLGETHWYNELPPSSINALLNNASEPFQVVGTDCRNIACPPGATPLFPPEGMLKESYATVGVFGMIDLQN